MSDMTAPLDNTEEGDVCVTHGGTFEGSYSDSLGPEFVDDAAPICSEVSGGFESGSDLCRFVHPPQEEKGETIR